MKQKQCGCNLGNNNINNIDFMLNGIALKQVEDFDYLGLNIDAELTFNKHIRNVVSNTSSKESQLHKVRNLIDENVALDIFKSTIIPTFDYADFLYHPTNISKRKKYSKCTK